MHYKEMNVGRTMFELTEEEQTQFEHYLYMEEMGRLALRYCRCVIGGDQTAICPVHGRWGW